ncbi:hypothetical protein CO046_03360 [Candidatus Peregrinibacteria bacterium CG_4_9_14_0_2_um_filter_53_11]|nr:MAG: hypothetical protein CO046_03360 [Candidatus Peregrinibacteria bacterium CG_4_9_14_0_2_um_filter_53_11]
MYTPVRMRKEKGIILESIIKSLLVISFLATIFVTRTAFFPFLFGKMIFYRVLIEGALALSLIYFWRFPDEVRALPGYQALRWKSKDPLWLALLLFFVSMVISTIWAFNPETAFFGSIERGEGLFAMLHYLAFLVMTVIFFNKNDWKIYFAGLVATGVISSLMAWGQYFGLSFSFPVNLTPASQPSSLIGNPAYMAGFLIILLAPLVLLWEFSSSRLSRWLLAAIGVLFLLTTVLTGIRGALIAIFMGAFVLTLYYVFRPTASRRTKKGAVLLLVAGVVFWGIFFATKNDPFWDKLPAFGRLSNLTTHSNSFQTRWFEYVTGWEAFKEKPVLGWGVENYFDAHNLYRDPRVSTYSEAWVDRSHNRLLDIAVMQGAVGLGAYLLFLAALFYKARKRPVLVAVLVAYVIQYLFLFDTMMTFVVAFSLFAFLINETARRHPVEAFVSHFRGRRRLAPSLLMLVGLPVLCVIFYLWLFIPVRQQLAFQKITRNLANYDLVRETLPAAYYPYNFYQYTVRYFAYEVFSYKYKRFGELYLPLLKDMAAGLEEAREHNPHDPRLHTRLIQIYKDIARYDESYRTRIADGLRTGIEEAPNAQKLYYALILDLVGSRDVDGALTIGEEVLRLNPTTARSHLYYAIALMQKSDALRNEGEIDEADKYKSKVFDELEETDAIARTYRGTDRQYLTKEDNITDTQYSLFPTQDFINMAALYTQFEAYKEIVRTLEVGHVLFPTNPRLTQDLFWGAVIIEDAEKFEEYSELVLKLNPSWKEDIESLRPLVKEGQWARIKADPWVHEMTGGIK